VPNPDIENLPGFLPAETEIFKRWVNETVPSAERWQYNVRVGLGTKPPPSFETNYARMVEMLSKPRIDVVAHRGEKVELIEIKVNAGPSAVGQLLMYRTLYEKSFGAGTVSSLLLLTDNIRPDTKGLAESHNVTYIVV